MTGNFYYGMSGIVLPFPKTSFPPDFQAGSRLEYYASLFNSLEVNSSFYKLPQRTTIAKWADAVADDFKFTFKLSKEITHTKNLAFQHEAVEAFMNTISAAEHKNGCILIQFPPSLSIEMLNQMQALLSEIAFLNNGVWKLAVEFRHNSWYEKEVSEILEEYGACMVLQDLPACTTPMEYTTGPTIYLRFHGPAGGYRGSYEDDFLKRYACRINEWLSEQKTIYCYFNNTMGDAVKNLQSLVGFREGEERMSAAGR